MLTYSYFQYSLSLKPKSEWFNIRTPMYKWKKDAQHQIVAFRDTKEHFMLMCLVKKQYMCIVKENKKWCTNLYMFLLKPKFPFPMCPLVINHSLSVSILMPNVRKNRLTNPITADFRKKLDLVNNIISDIPKPSLLCAYTFQLKCLEGTEVCSFL